VPFLHALFCSILFIVQQALCVVAFYSSPTGQSTKRYVLFIVSSCSPKYRDYYQWRRISIQRAPSLNFPLQIGTLVPTCQPENRCFWVQSVPVRALRYPADPQFASYMVHVFLRKASTGCFGLDVHIPQISEVVPRIKRRPLIRSDVFFCFGSHTGQEFSLLMLPSPNLLMYALQAAVELLGIFFKAKMNFPIHGIL